MFILYKKGIIHKNINDIKISVVDRKNKEEVHDKIIIKTKT
jgi:hypothetical protein